MVEQSDTTVTRRLLPVFISVFTAACVVLPPPGTPVPPRVEILRTDPRAAQYGASAAEILNHPELRDKIRQLFGADWSPAPDRRAAPAFFAKSAPTSVLRIGGSDYIAAPGCVPEACLNDRGLILIRADGQQLLARLDQGGFTRYYAFGIGVGIETVGTPRDRGILDAAWRELAREPGVARILEPPAQTRERKVETPEPEAPPAPAVRTPEPTVTWRDKASRCYEDLRRGRTVYYEGRYRGLYLVGRAACDQYVEDMELLETKRRPPDAIPPLEIMQLETELRRPAAR